MPARIQSPQEWVRQVDPQRRVRPTEHRPARSQLRLPAELEQGFEREFRTTMRITKTPAEQSAETMRDFAEEFGGLARNKRAFHNMMKKVYGAGYDAKAAETFRRHALEGDYTWLPPIRWVDRSTLQGGNGAYNSADNVIYLAKDLKERPALAAQVYAEETGHFLDTKLNRTDAVGDEGEMFRRLLSGEKLSRAQVRAIREENDKGTIVVDGKRVEVEFWSLKKIGKAVAKPFKKVGSAIKNIGKGIGKAIGGFAGGLAKGVGGFVSNMAQGRVGSAFGSLWNGLDDAFLKAPVALFSHTLDAFKDLTDAGTYLLGPLGKYIRKITDRAHDAVRTVLMGGLGVAAGALRSVIEGAGTFVSGFGKLLTGDFKGAWKRWRDGFLQAAVKAPINALILGLGSGVSAIQTLFGLEKPGKRLTPEQVAELRQVYGDSIDYDEVRIKTGGAGLFSTNDRPFVLGNTIYMKDADPEGDTLIHEMCHVWQYQNGGSDYLTDALVSQQWGKGYDWKQSVPETAWGDLEPEQQAAFVEAAYAYGAFDPTSPSYGTFSWGNEDLTAYLREVVRKLESGSGAP